MYEVKFAPNSIEAIKSLIFEQAKPAINSSMRLTFAGDNAWPVGATLTINKDSSSSSSSSSSGENVNTCTLYPILFDPLILDMPEVAGVIIDKEAQAWQTQDLVVEPNESSSSISTSSSSNANSSDLYSISLPDNRIANSKVTLINLFDGKLLRPGYDYEIDEDTNSVNFLKTWYNGMTVRTGYFVLVPQTQNSSSNEALQKTVQMVINQINQNSLTLGILAISLKEDPYTIILTSIYPNGDCLFVEGVGTTGRILINGINTLGPIYFSGYKSNDRSYAVGTTMPTEEEKYIYGIAGTSIPTISPKIYFDQDFEGLTLEQARDMGEYVEKGILQVDHINEDGSFDCTLTADNIYELARGVVVMP